MAAETEKAKIRSGSLVPNFRLPATNRPGQLGPPDYKQHLNLVLMFFPSAECKPCKRLLREIANRHEEYKQLEAEVLAISTDSKARLRQLASDLDLPFPVLSDNDATVTNQYLTTEEVAKKAAIFVTDRWGEVFAKIFEPDRNLRAALDVREWLEFIELQCEECFPPERPS